jgi:hypothetical protein
MKRIALKKIGKTAVMMGRVGHDRKCRVWTGQVGRAAALLLNHPRLRKLM